MDKALLKGFDVHPALAGSGIGPVNNLFDAELNIGYNASPPKLAGGDCHRREQLIFSGEEA